MSKNSIHFQWESILKFVLATMFLAFVNGYTLMPNDYLQSGSEVLQSPLTSFYLTIENQALEFSVDRQGVPAQHQLLKLTTARHT